MASTSPAMSSACDTTSKPGTDTAPGRQPSVCSPALRTSHSATRRPSRCHWRSVATSTRGTRERSLTRRPKALLEVCTPDTASSPARRQATMPPASAATLA